MTVESRDPRAGWTQWEKDEFDARADHEAWSYAHSLLTPMVELAREIGSDELTQVMEKALAELEGEVNRTVDVLEALRAEASPAGS
jgi:hypothetical protein